MIVKTVARPMIFFLAATGQNGLGGAMPAWRPAFQTVA
jgi:hypothetical protein